MPHTEGDPKFTAPGVQMTPRLHHPIWQEHDSRLKVLMMIKGLMSSSQDPYEYCWLVRVGFRLAQSLWKEQCNSGIGLIQFFRDEGAHELAMKLCNMTLVALD